ncbi:MAG: hypothetical protein Q8O84_02795 [Nanoarchaeota archaeon]|nr:hypothetical protein [Nanoarchaeota archaeon]
MSKEKFYVSHYINEPVFENDPLKRIGFLTTLDKNITNKTEFYIGFDTEKTFTKKNLESEFKEKKAIELPRPLHEIQKSESTWMDKNKNIYLADDFKPFGDKEMIKLSEHNNF